MSAELKPQKVYLGKNIPQVQKIKCVTGAALAGKYFVFMDSAGAKHYAWFTTGASSDPAPAGGWTGHSVTIAADDTASEVATALTAVLTAVTGFDAAASGVYVTLTHTANGYAQPARDGAAQPTGFSFYVITKGQTKRSAGCIQGDIELGNLAKQMTDITCHATGTTVKDRKVTGMGVPNLTLSLQDISKSELESILHDFGQNSFTPEGADKETVFGLGVEGVGQSVDKIQVELHPVALEDADKSEDTTMWKASVNLDSINWSGENPTVVPLNMDLYPDESKPKQIQYLMIGDATLAGY